MKYLYLIIRHVFPRHKWEIIGKTPVQPEGHSNPIAIILTLQDQFGNIKTEKIKE